MLMAPSNDTEDIFTPQELRRWLTEELSDVTKAFQLRITDAIDLVSRSSAGEISPKEATRRLHAYDARWGEALPGASASTGLSDAQILSAIDEALADKSKKKFADRLFQKRLAKDPSL